MAQVFISHASQDLAVASRLAGWLRDAGHKVFLDQDLHDGLRVGDAWANRLFAELYTADGLVAVVTAAFAASPWCAAEVGIARAHGVRILPVRAEEGVSHRLVSTETQWTDLDSDGTRARAALVEALRQIDDTGGAPWSAGLPIYPGLVPFDAGQARVFFGRADEARRLAERLRAPASPAGAGLLAVVGPSGCGKSSLVRAGLCPLLAAEPDWLVLPPLVPAADPDADPVTALGRLLTAEARRRELGWASGRAGAELGDPGGLARLAADLLADAQSARHLLLVVDQAEELLTRTTEPARRHFAALLREATGGLGLVRAVATLRSEFLDPLSALAARKCLPLAPFLLSPLVHDLLRLVITGPAHHAGITVDDELVARMAADTGSGDALPLLAFVLNQLAEGVPRGGRLSPQRYTELGGVQGALARQADAALAAATATTGRTKPDVVAGLLRLVTVDEAGQVSRRRVALASLPDQVRAELDVFVTYRLLTTTSDPAGDPVNHAGTSRPVIDVAHEQVLTSWPPLAAAIAAETDTLRLRTSAADATEEWERAGRPTDHLWELSRATGAAHALNVDDLTPATRAFLAASRRHGQRRRLRAISILSILLLLVTAGGIIALVQWRNATDRGRAIERARLEAVVDGLLTRADAARDSDPRAALRYGLAADTIAPSPTTTSNLLDTLTDTDFVSAIATGHTRPVNAVAYSADGRTLATGSNDTRVILWDVGDPARPRRIGDPLTGHASSVSDVAFSPDRRTLATGSADSVILWDVADPARPRRLGDPLRAHTAPVSDVAFSPDGRTLATASDDTTVILWDVGDPARPRRIGDPLTGHASSVSDVAFSPDRRTLATGSADSVILWDVGDPARPRRLGDPLRAHTASVSDVAFSPDRRTLATASQDKTVVLWDVADPARPRRLGDPLHGHSDFVLSAVFSPDGRTLATASADTTVILWDVADPARPRRIGGPLRGHTSFVNSAAFSPDGRTLATGSWDKTVVLWDVAGPTRPRRLGDPLTGQSGTVWSVAFTADGRTLATGSNDTTVVLWDVGDPARPRRLGDPLRAHTAPVSDVAFSPDGRTLATGSWDKTVVLWDVADPARPRRLGDPLTGHIGAVWTVAYSPDGRTLATGSTDGRDGMVLLWDVADPARPRRLGDPLPGPIGPVSKVAFSPDGRTLATGSWDTTVVLWDVADPARPRRLGNPLENLTGPVWMVAFSADGYTFATSNADKTVVLWDVGDPAKPRRLGDPLTGHTSDVWSAVFSADGRTLATGSRDKTVVLWDVADPARPHRLGDPLTGHAGTVSSVAFSPDGRTLATGSDDNIVILWDVSIIGELRRHAHEFACQRAGIGLSEGQWDRYVRGLPYEKTC